MHLRRFSYISKSGFPVNSYCHTVVCSDWLISVFHREERCEDGAAVFWYVLSHGSSCIHWLMEGDRWVFLSLLPDLFSVSVTSSLNVLNSVVAGNDNYVWQSLGVLHEGLTVSPSNAQFKLLLLLVYCQLGAFEPVVDLYTSLDAKHVQHDTIGSVQIHNGISACIYQGGKGWQRGIHTYLLVSFWQLGVLDNDIKRRKVITWFDFSAKRTIFGQLSVMFDDLARDLSTKMYFLVLSSRFLLTRYAESLGQFAAASQTCNFSLRFFHSNQKDVSPPLFVISDSFKAGVHVFLYLFCLFFISPSLFLSSRPQSISSRRINTERSRKSQSSSLSGTGWTNRCTSPSVALRGCCWICS